MTASVKSVLFVQPAIQHLHNTGTGVYNSTQHQKSGADQI